MVGQSDFDGRRPAEVVEFDVLDGEAATEPLVLVLPRRRARAAAGTRSSTCEVRRRRRQRSGAGRERSAAGTPTRRGPRPARRAVFPWPPAGCARNRARRSAAIRRHHCPPERRPPASRSTRRQPGSSLPGSPCTRGRRSRHRPRSHRVDSGVSIGPSGSTTIHRPNPDGESATTTALCPRVNHGQMIPAPKSPEAVDLPPT